MDHKEVPYVKKIQAAAAAYYKKADKRTSVDVIEHYGEVTAAYKNYLMYETAGIEKAMGTNVYKE